MFQKVILLKHMKQNSINNSLQNFKLILHWKRVAQWIEHQIPILEVKGSIPFMLNILKI